MSINPPSLPEKLSAIDVRKAHFRHESSIRSISILYYFVGAMMSLVALAQLLPRPDGFSLRIFLFSISSLFAAAHFLLAVWLRKLDSRARIPATVLAVLGLFTFPVGTLINGYIIYLLNSAKGVKVFSKEYIQAIQETPEIKYKTSFVVLLLVGILLFLLLVAVLAPLISMISGGK